MTEPAGRAPARPGRVRAALARVRPPWRRWSLRTRVMAAFGLGALAVSALFALITWNLAAGYMLDQREISTLRQAASHAQLVEAEVRRPDGLTELLTGLAAGPDSAVFVHTPDGWFGTSSQIDPGRLPPALLAAVDGGAIARQRFSVDGTPVIAVGVPMHTGAQYIEVFSLRELDATFRFLSGMLVAGTVVAGLLGAAAGRWAGRRALRPLTELTAAAGRVAAGDLDVRLPTRDDPDLAPLAAAFNDTTESLQRRFARDARFAGDVSHELRSPVTTMLNALAVLVRRRDGLPPSARHAVDLLETDLSRFRRLVDDLLEISRVDQGRVRLQRERLDVAELVRHAAEPLRADVPVEVAGTRPMVFGDRRRLERVVGNLVENAERHGGGLVRLAVSGQDATARVEVDDAGPGVPAEDRARIFERFARGPAAARDLDDTGTGLGLALASQHVHLHGGRLWVEDRPGGGARFVVEMAEADP